MSRVGFIVRNKADGVEYFYLRKSVRVKDQVKKRNLFSFGNRDVAINKINEWINDESSFPKKLRDLNFSLEDARKWLEVIEK